MCCVCSKCSNWRAGKKLRTEESAGQGVVSIGIYDDEPKKGYGLITMTYGEGQVSFARTRKPKE